MAHEQHDQLIELSRQQTNPYEARGQDFPVTTAAEAAKQALPGHGERGDTFAEYHELLSESDQDDKAQLSGKGAPRT